MEREMKIRMRSPGRRKKLGRNVIAGPSLSSFRCFHQYLFSNPALAVPSVIVQNCVYIRIVCGIFGVSVDNDRGTASSPGFWGIRHYGLGC